MTEVAVAGQFGRQPRLDALPEVRRGPIDVGEAIFPSQVTGAK